MPVDPNKPSSKPKLGEPSRRPKGIRTRQRLLTELKAALAARSFKDVKISDLTKAVGITPAAFYQYFPDLRSAVLVLAEEMVEDANSLPLLVLGDWMEDGMRLAERLVDSFLEFWDRHAPVMRVVELGIDEEDPMFREVRREMFNDTYLALGFAMANLYVDEGHPTGVEPRASAAAALASVIHVASGRSRFQPWHQLGLDDLRQALIDLVYTMMVRPGQRRVGMG